MNDTIPAFIAVLSMLCLMSSCTVFKTLRYMNFKEVSPTRISYLDKDILIVPVAHIGRPEFYDALKDSIQFWKSGGYRIYYEQVIDEQEAMGLDSTEMDTLQRQWRRFSGSGGYNRDSYESALSVFKNKVVQPDWPDMGITDSDLNADITLHDFISEYERTIRPITLTECDYSTHLDSSYMCWLTDDIKRHRLPEDIALHYRNEHVVDLIQAENDEKIVIIYGASHLEGFEALLK